MSGDFTPQLLRSTATVKAAHLTDDADWEAIAAWCGGTLHTDDSAGAVGCEPTTLIRVPASTGDGFEEAHEGDWIIAYPYEGETEPTYQVVLGWNVGPDVPEGEGSWWEPIDPTVTVGWVVLTSYVDRGQHGQRGFDLNWDGELHVERTLAEASAIDARDTCSDIVVGTVAARLADLPTWWPPADRRDIQAQEAEAFADDEPAPAGPTSVGQAIQEGIEAGNRDWLAHRAAERREAQS